MYHLIADSAAQLASFLAGSRALHLIELTGDGAIRAVSEAFALHLGIPAGSLAGVPVWRHLTDPDGERLRALMAGPATERWLTLNFSDDARQPFTLNCFVRVAPEGTLVLGEPVYGDEQRLQRQLMALNEDLANLARERHRAVANEKRARLDAEQANRIKDEALAVIADELRQPLGAAATALAVLAQRPERLDHVRANLAPDPADDRAGRRPAAGVARHAGPHRARPRAGRSQKGGR